MLKRLFDILVAATALLLLSPIIVAVAIAVRLDLGSPVLFRQDRPGLNGAVFEMMKFRSMRDPTPRRTTDADRVTRFGAFLRRTSLDELPGLFNVLRGDMSLVGPRPLLVDYLPLYSPEQARRHEVRPGLTGWAQVNGRNAVDWPEKFALDTWYVDNRSFWLDLKILLKTVWIVLARSGIDGDEGTGMTRFHGNPD